jgi:hypothetical protein
MSSETSTESESLQPWQLFTLAGLVGATIVVFMSRGQSPAAIVLLSLTIFTAAAVGLAAWRTLGPLANADEVATAPQVLGGRTRAALEREKALALRALKELEFDRAMGKVSEKDFTEMSARLRARAARLLVQLDAATGYRDLIEQEVARRVARATGGADGAEPGLPRAPAASTHPAPLACDACGTSNDGDARFCKRCGASLRPTA